MPKQRVVELILCAEVKRIDNERVTWSFWWNQEPVSRNEWIEDPNKRAIAKFWTNVGQEAPLSHEVQIGDQFQIYEKVTHWSKSCGRSHLASLLSEYILPCESILSVDDIIVASLFGRGPNKALHRRHDPLTLAKDIDIEEPMKRMINLLFEVNKREFFTGDGRRTIAIAKELAEQICAQHERMDCSALTWCLAAYPQIVSPHAAVRLEVSELAGVNQFKVVARRNLVANEFIFDAPGLLSVDSSDEHEHSSLSELSPHTDQVSSPMEQTSRLFIGPIRFVNHRCDDWNTSYVAMTGSLGYVLQTRQAVCIGDEITVDYGQSFFTDLPGGCQCERHHPEAHMQPRVQRERVQIVLTPEERLRKVQRYRARKHKKQMQNKKLGKQNNVEFGGSAAKT